MPTSSRRTGAGTVGASAFQRSGPFGYSSITRSDASSFTAASSSSFASYSSSYSSTRSAGFFSQHRSASPTRVSLHGISPPRASHSVRFSIDRSRSPGRSIAAPQTRNQVVQRNSGSNRKRTCLCSPTTHPGSFRCSLHKNGGNSNNSLPYSPNRLNMRRSAMTNSLVRIGSVEGDLVNRALAALIRPSSHQQRRRADFRPRSSRLSIMTKAEDLLRN